jgi:hypothetical protein
MRWLLVCLVAVAGCGGDHPDEVSRPPDVGSDPGVGGNTPIVLPEHCPCPLGSYCEWASNSCKLGCLGDDHCPIGQRCDTTVFQCAHVCAVDADCANHLACTRTPTGFTICKGCASGWANCNNMPDDGCEAPLDTLNDCGACAKPATTMCYTDHDGDGYADPAIPLVRRCHCQTGERYDSKGSDCDDNDYRAHPGQTSFFTSARTSGGFDFDCDGVVTRYPELSVNGSCSWPCRDAFWIDTQPACGTMGDVLDCYQWDTESCGTRKYRSLLETCR